MREPRLRITALGYNGTFCDRLSTIELSQAFLSFPNKSDFQHKKKLKIFAVEFEIKSLNSDKQS